MPSYRISEAASLLAVSDDTVRRWVDAGRLPVDTDASGRSVVDGVALATLAVALAKAPEPSSAAGASARNHLTGLVTHVTRDGVMAQVELQAGPFRIVSLISREAADELGLAPGVRATATVKSTNVTIEVPRP